MASLSSDWMGFRPSRRSSAPGPHFPALAFVALLLAGCGEEERQVARKEARPTEPLPGYSGTLIALHLRDTDGRPVAPSKVELELVAWGDNERLPLRSAGSRVFLPLDTTWLKERWTPSRGLYYWGYLYLEADGYASIRSDRFYWSGSRTDDHAPVTMTRLRFPCGAEARVRPGGQAECTVAFRRPRPRTLRLVDTQGQAVAGVKVSSYRFFSSNNHCNALSGCEPLGTAVSDAEGRVPVIDGDFEYAFEFRKPGWLLLEPQSWDAMRLVTRLETEETSVVFQEMERRPLQLVVKEGSAVAGGRVLFGALAHAGCGVNRGPLATTDDQGRITLPDFRPERYAEIYFPDGNQRPLWTADPREARFAERVVIDLAADH